jgi:hypothetical protein
MLSGNTCCSAVDLLRENPDKIDWYILSGNTSDAAVELLWKIPI